MKELVHKIEDLSVEKPFKYTLSAGDAKRLTELRKAHLLKRNKSRCSWKLTPASNLRSMGIAVASFTPVSDIPVCSTFWESISAYSVPSRSGGFD